MMDLVELSERYWDELSSTLDQDQRRAFKAMMNCRQQSAGGSYYACTSCGHVHYHCRSCGNRFCSRCQNHRASQWLHRQKQRLLPCPYFMVTFTLSSSLRAIPRWRRKEMFDALFMASSQALKEMCKDRLGGECGMIGVLHTHGRDLCYHPHIHYIVPGLVLNSQEKLLRVIKKNYLVNNKALGALYRGKFLAALTEHKIGFQSSLYAKKWNVDCRSVGQGLHALEYLSRYLMRGVVSEQSLSEKEDKVRLRYKDSQTKRMDSKDFGPVEFLQRLAQHVLPRGFHRVREYGFLAPAAKKKLFLMQNLLEVKIPNDPPPKLPALRCSLCQGIMLPIGRVISEGRLKQESLVSVGARSPPIVSIS
ncbi:hypothetical transposase [Lentisphaera araneosa HTCC2155]|uniref:Hypothetical transposase n=1 Tax=Lentisphaera araneosa HTCC2155 TaxID=313628 RepID=A6DN83_9BACT|nr:IS91 family transposase [Lentisphaera araneosa]EDM25265.1 hypothetical transposase [Lentisphaera araneosa HTCC2155]EDM26831.1 hypothetical transposase [Lentisphaera araneosa HTCC2155]